MKATLVHDEERFHVGVSTDVSVRIYSYYRCIDAENVVVDQEEDGVLYFDVPATLNYGVYGVEVKGKINGLPWRTATDCVIKITNSTQRNEGSEAVPDGDTYDITMVVQLYKQQSSDRAIEEHNSDEASHPYILGELERIEGEIPTLPEHVVTDENYVHTDNNYTDTDKSKLDSALQSETDPTVPSWAKQSTKPSYTAQDVGALPSNTKYGSTVDMTMDSTTYVLTLSLKDQDGTVLNTKTVDLPIESVVVNGRYDATNKKIVLTLQSGSTINVPVGDLIAGLQTEITSVNMLDADLVDDTNSTHKFVTEQEKQAWNNKSDFSGSYNDLSDKPTIPAAQIQSDWNQTDSSAKDFIKNKPTIPVVPTNVSSFTNDAGYVIKTVDDLVNYYLKNEVYTKTEVANLIAAIQQFHYEIYASTSDVTSPQGNVLYLIGPMGTGADKYEEYVYDTTKQEPWVKIGDTSIDLSDYYTKGQTDSAITQALNAALANYTTAEALAQLLAAKQDTLVFNTAYNATTNKAATMADMPTTMGASGSTHKGGLVPDTPSTAGTTKFLREDGTWAEPAGDGGGSAYVPTLNAAPTSSTTTYTKDGQTVDFEIGQFCRVAKQGGWYVFYQLYDLVTESNVTTATWEEVNNIQYNYEDVYITVGLIEGVPQGTTVSGLTINVYYNDAVQPTTTITTDSNGMASLQVPNGYRYKLVFPEQTGCTPIAAIEHTAMLLQRGIEVYYRSLETSIRTVWINPANASAALEHDGGLSLLEDYVQRCKCYVFTADGSKKAEIKSATFSGNYSGMTAGTVTFADDTTINISTLNNAGCNFMVLRPALHVWCGEEGGAEVLKCTGAYDLLGEGKKTFPKKYIGMFKAFNQNGVLKSQPNRIPTGTQTITIFQSQALAGNPNNVAAANGYGLWNYSDWCKENALHLAWFANTNYEDNVGTGRINDYNRVRNIVTGFTLPYTGKYQCAAAPSPDSAGNYVNSLNFFGIEGMGEQIWEFVIGFRHDGAGNAYVWDENEWSETHAADRTLTLPVTSASQAYIKTIIAGQNFDMMPRAVNASATTGMCDGHWISDNGRLLSVGGDAHYGSICGLSCSSANAAFSSSAASFGARLAFYGEPETVTGSAFVAAL